MSHCYRCERWTSQIFKSRVEKTSRSHFCFDICCAQQPSIMYIINIMKWNCVLEAKNKKSIFAALSGVLIVLAIAVHHNNPAYDGDPKLLPRREFIFFIPSRFHFQTELNFLCPYCSVMTYFDYLNQAGYISAKLYCSSQMKTKMTVKRLKFSFWYPHTLKSKCNQGQAWCFCNISSCCFFYNCYFIFT